MRATRSVANLSAWAKERAVALPAAFLEWATFDDGSLLTKYSNDDWFWFDSPEVVVTPNGVRGLRFHSENQNNFDRLITLDHGDDPSVLFAWLGRPPWVTNAERFSDAVFSQVFDWQFRLEFKPDDPNYKEIACTREIHLKTDGCIPLLRHHYEESVTTRLIVEDDYYTEYRFLGPQAQRLTVTVANGRSTTISVTGRPFEQVNAVYEELKSKLAGAGVI